MKRVDLDNAEMAFLYKEEGSPDLPPEMTEENVKAALGLIAKITSEPLKHVNMVMSTVLKREIQGVYIPMSPEGQIFGVTVTGNKIAPAIQALETALMRLREAHKKEIS